MLQDRRDRATHRAIANLVRCEEVLDAVEADEGLEGACVLVLHSFDDVRSTAPGGDLADAAIARTL